MTDAATHPEPELIARALIRHNTRLLLVREKGKSWWFLPGGHREPGEVLEEALRRELLEELGADARLGSLRSVIEHSYTDNGAHHYEVNFLFEVTLDDHDVISREDHLEFGWHDMDSLPEVRPGPVVHALSASLESGTSWYPFKLNQVDD
ncbi:NUDIX domain-containing protein [Saccharopolyspora endophytica]|uniref:NUDIX domain-containing protein n=1 Tax=Saccharopolyspora endophytica TaxID=543886 RepID=A0ABS5DQP8_9PSEU|nr:NUDIX domain-containing protein [Saccharopolyspora endophytica]MBQ0928630.1 NUDIX domain-containing protein [Saccharopolyspora endophytica]